MEHIFREATETEGHLGNMNKEGFSLSRSLKPLIWILMEWKKVLSTEK